MSPGCRQNSGCLSTKGWWTLQLPEATAGNQHHDTCCSLHFPFSQHAALQDLAPDHLPSSEWLAQHRRAFIKGLPAYMLPSYRLVYITVQVFRLKSPKNKSRGKGAYGKGTH